MSRLDDDEKDHDQESSESKISSKSYEDMIQSKPTFHKTLTMVSHFRFGRCMVLQSSLPEYVHGNGHDDEIRLVAL